MQAEEADVVGTAASEEPIPPGWYPEPNNPSRQRYWDGEEWGKLYKAPKERATGKANRLAVTALILACLDPLFEGPASPAS